MRKALAYKGRSIWKGKFFQFISLNKNKLNRTYYLRKCDIGKEVYVYNGRLFYKFKILSKYIGYRIGQFIFTKKIGKNIHMKKKKVQSLKKIKKLKK